MNTLIYNFLLDYYKTESTCLNISKNRFITDNIRTLYLNKKINEDEMNELLNNLDKTIQYVIKVFSECPYININLNNYTNYTKSYKDNNGYYV